MPTLLKLIPKGTKTLVSPFLGGGSLELACAANGMKVFGADLFEPLVNFWNYLLQNPEVLADRVEKYFPLPRERFYALQKRFMTLTDDRERAAAFFVLNRSSFSGTTLSGGMSPGHKRFTKSSIERLRTFRAPNLKVGHADFKETLRKHPEAFLYLDPPYLIDQKLYGNKGSMQDNFDHEGLAAMLHERSGWILSYNDSERVRELYEGFEMLTPNWKYGMSSNKASRELLVRNIDAT